VSDLLPLNSCIIEKGSQDLMAAVARKYVWIAISVECEPEFMFGQTVQRQWRQKNRRQPQSALLNKTEKNSEQPQSTKMPS
jgi:hypothetical protein